MSEKKDLSRAELVRKRRTQERAKQVDRIVKDAARPLPPVTMRVKSRPVTSRPQGSKPRQTNGARRRFQISLPAVPNARQGFRSISIPRPGFSWRFVSLALAVTLGVLIYLAFNLPQLRVTVVQLTGNQLLTAAEVNAVLNISGQPIFLVNPSDLETRLRLNYPELVYVRVNIGLPNQITVNVSERRPVIRWEQGGGYTWIAEDGVAFKPRGELTGLISVVAQSTPPASDTKADLLNPAPFISADMVHAVEGLAGHVPPGQSVVYDARMGFGWTDPRGWVVYFGETGSDIELKMRVYESMVNSLTQRGIRPALINVTYPTAPYYRMTQ